MTNNNKKRSSIDEITDDGEQLDWVGGRHRDNQAPGGGGGYPDTCRRHSFLDGGSGGKTDPRLDELRQMGLGLVWLQIADAIGFDAFMTMWRILDADNTNVGDRLRVWVPTYRRYTRFQRNRYIQTRALDDKVEPEIIQRELKKITGESISITHIKLTVSKANIEG